MKMILRRARGRFIIHREARWPRSLNRARHARPYFSKKLARARHVIPLLTLITRFRAHLREALLTTAEYYTNTLSKRTSEFRAISPHDLHAARRVSSFSPRDQRRARIFAISFTRRSSAANYSAIIKALKCSREQSRVPERSAHSPRPPPPLSLPSRRLAPSLPLFLYVTISFTVRLKCFQVCFQASRSIQLAGFLITFARPPSLPPTASNGVLFERFSFFPGRVITNSKWLIDVGCPRVSRACRDPPPREFAGRAVLSRPTGARMLRTREIQIGWSFPPSADISFFRAEG